MEQNKYIIYDEPYMFEDVILCAFRYAITRHTYVVCEILDFIKHNSHLLNQRMWNVLKTDLFKAIEDYETHDMKEYEKIDYETLLLFNDWLDAYRKGCDW